MMKLAKRKELLLLNTNMYKTLTLIGINFFFREFVLLLEPEFQVSKFLNFRVSTLRESVCKGVKT